MTKSILEQYINEMQEVEEVKEKIERLNNKIRRLEDAIVKIEEGETVKDKVYGGNGGLQSYVIEGVPYGEWDDKKIELGFKKKMLEQQKTLLETMENHLVLRTYEVQKYVCSIKDSLTRRIVEYRVFQGLRWSEVAEKIGGNNTEDGVKKVFYRFIEQNG